MSKNYPHASRKIEQRFVPNPKESPRHFKSYIDNFRMVSSKVSEKLNRISPKSYSAFKEKSEKQQKILVNGVNYFEEQIGLLLRAEVLADCVAVKGDHFYLKKGEQVWIKNSIKGYVEIEYKKFKGYFPSNFFKFVDES